MIIASRLPKRRKHLRHSMHPGIYDVGAKEHTSSTSSSHNSPYLTFHGASAAKDALRIREWAS